MPIRHERCGDVDRLILCRGERGNPFDGPFCTALRAAAEALGRRSDVRAVLIASEGTNFSVGGDLRALAADRNALPGFVASAVGDLNAAVAALTALDAPVVVAVQGNAAGGAVGLAAAADFVLAAANARFVAAFPAIGFSPDTGCSTSLPRRVGWPRATEFYLLAESWTAERAADLGLVNRVVACDSLATEAVALAERLARGPTRAFGETRRLLAAALQPQLEREAAALVRLAATSDAWNGINAVLARTTPTFEGR